MSKTLYISILVDTLPTIPSYDAYYLILSDIKTNDGININLYKYFLSNTLKPNPVLVNIKNGDCIYINSNLSKNYCYYTCSTYKYIDDSLVLFKEQEYYITNKFLYFVSNGDIVNKLCFDTKTVDKTILVPDNGSYELKVSIILPTNDFDITVNENSDINQENGTLILNPNYADITFTTDQFGTYNPYFIYSYFDLTNIVLITIRNLLFRTDIPQPINNICITPFIIRYAYITNSIIYRNNELYTFNDYNSILEKNPCINVFTNTNNGYRFKSVNPNQKYKLSIIANLTLLKDSRGSNLIICMRELNTSTGIPIASYDFFVIENIKSVKPYGGTFETTIYIPELFQFFIIFRNNDVNVNNIKINISLSQLYD